CPRCATRSASSSTPTAAATRWRSSPVRRSPPRSSPRPTPSSAPPPASPWRPSAVNSVAPEGTRTYDPNPEADMGLDAFVHCRCWQDDGCPHEDMEQVAVRVSNWSGYRAFQQALSEAGCEHFPVLCAELPDGNGGQLAPNLAREALEELRYF